MSLRELTLEGEVDKVAVAIERLRAFEPKDGYYLAFSGGKDSIVILDLAKEAGVKFDAHYHVTQLDPPELVRFIKTFPDVEWDMPSESPWALFRRKGFLPTRVARYCCEVLKERGGADRIVVTGVRALESARRSKRRMMEPCLRDKRKTFLNPIIDWSGDEVWQYIRERELPYCSLYDEGFERLGCVLCPTALSRMSREAERWPKIAAQWRRVAYDIVAAKSPDDVRHKFKDGDEYFEWWMSGAGLPNDNQLEMGVYE